MIKYKNFFKKPIFVLPKETVYSTDQVGRHRIKSSLAGDREQGFMTLLFSVHCGRSRK